MLPFVSNERGTRVGSEDGGGVFCGDNMGLRKEDMCDIEFLKPRSKSAFTQFYQTLQGK